jgi:hypothetical protein
MRQAPEMADTWEVWRDDRIDGIGVARRRFRSFKAAERYAHAYVGASTRERFAVSVEITLNMHTIASVRADGLNRVWTDVVDTALL